MVNQSNYFSEVEKIGLKNLPEPIQEMHKLIIEATLNGKAWTKAMADKDLNEIFTLQFDTIAKLAAKKAPAPAPKPAPAKEAKPGSEAVWAARVEINTTNLQIRPEKRFKKTIVINGAYRIVAERIRKEFTVIPFLESEVSYFDNSAEVRFKDNKTGEMLVFVEVTRISTGANAEFYEAMHLDKIADEVNAVVGMEMAQAALKTLKVEPKGDKPTKTLAFLTICEAIGYDKDSKAAGSKGAVKVWEGINVPADINQMLVRKGLKTDYTSDERNKFRIDIENPKGRIVFQYLDKVASHVKQYEAADILEVFNNVADKMLAESSKKKPKPNLVICQYNQGNYRPMHIDLSKKQFWMEDNLSDATFFDADSLEETKVILQKVAVKYAGTNFQIQDVEGKVLYEFSHRGVPIPANTKKVVIKTWPKGNGGNEPKYLFMTNGFIRWQKDEADALRWPETEKEHVITFAKQLAKDHPEQRYVVTYTRGSSVNMPEVLYDSGKTEKAPADAPKAAPKVSSEETDITIIQVEIPEASVFAFDRTIVGGNEYAHFRRMFREYFTPFNLTWNKLSDTEITFSFNSGWAKISLEKAPKGMKFGSQADAQMTLKNYLQKVEKLVNHQKENPTAAPVLNLLVFEENHKGFSALQIDNLVKGEYERVENYFNATAYKNEQLAPLKAFASMLAKRNGGYKYEVRNKRMEVLFSVQETADGIKKEDPAEEKAPKVQKTKVPKVPKEKKEKAAPAKKAPAPAGEQVRHYSEEVSLLRRTSALEGKKITTKQFINLSRAFEKAVTTGKINKKSKEGALIVDLQLKFKKLVDELVTEGIETIDFTLQGDMGKRIKDAASEQALYASIPLLVRYINMMGAKPETSKVERLYKAIDNALAGEKVNRKDPYYKHLIEVKHTLKAYTLNQSKPLQLTPATLKGLAGIPELGELVGK